jgi:AhpD family alkylhydroperoxidase
MAHVPVPEQLPGIISLFAFRPETAKPLSDLAEILLRGPSTLTRAERELIASHVSNLNQCVFCTRSHSAFAAQYLNGDEALVE